MTYVTADIHGHLQQFHNLIRGLPLFGDDTLYILGDVIDRGSDGVDIIREIRQMRNVILIKGNHEQMCVDTLGDKNVYGAKGVWLANGGESTYMELTKLCTKQERRDIVFYLSSLPEQMAVTVKGQDYILVHAAPGQDKNTRMWARPDEVDWDSIVPNGTTAVIGHTPTRFLTTERSDDGYQPIFFDNRYICIDCGCGEHRPDSALGCLRLDDLRTYYFA